MNLSERLDLFLIVQKDFIKEIQEFIKNKEISLDERWKLFVKADDLLPVGPYYISFEELDKYKIDYDDLGYARYELASFICLEERIEDRYKLVDMSALKEEMLATGYSGFEFDW